MQKNVSLGGPARGLQFTCHPYQFEVLYGIFNMDMALSIQSDYEN
jgi:hypothetical protein